MNDKPCKKIPKAIINPAPIKVRAEVKKAFSEEERNTAKRIRTLSALHVVPIFDFFEVVPVLFAFAA